MLFPFKIVMVPARALLGFVGVMIAACFVGYGAFIGMIYIHAPHLAGIVAFIAFCLSFAAAYDKD